MGNSGCGDASGCFGCAVYLIIGILVLSALFAVAG